MSACSIRNNFLYAVKGGPLRVPPRGPGQARRACGLSGPTRRASRSRAQETSSTRTTARTPHQSRGDVLLAANRPAYERSVKSAAPEPGVWR